VGLADAAVAVADAVVVVEAPVVLAQPVRLRPERRPLHPQHRLLQQPFQPASSISGVCRRGFPTVGAVTDRAFYNHSVVLRTTFLFVGL
jgi:hypothetical protein